MRYMAIAAASAMAIASCSETPPEPDMLVCATFSFRAANRAEILRARRDFFDAALLIRRDFSDSSNTSTGAELAPWSYTHAEIRLYSGGNARVVLGGHSDYPKGRDPASDIQVYLFAENDPKTSKTCTRHARALYAQVRARMAEDRTIVDDPDVPYRIDAGKRVRVAD